MSSKKRWYLVHLALGLLSASLALSCSAILDLDKLKSKPKGDGPHDAPASSETTLNPDKPPVLIDYGRCVAGTNCQTGKPGICAIGKKRCFEGSTDGVCDLVTQPGAVKEVCDGQDNNCNGTTDEVTCQFGMGCFNTGGKWGCNCGAAGGPVCTHGNTCVIVSGTTKACRCGTNKINCAAADMCEGDACKCGTTSSTTGPACGSTKNCVSGTCVNKFDAGPDKTVIDRAPPQPDQPKPTPDQPKPTPDQAASQ